jgi:POT family proton-dependent oligopeptide transporter
VFAYLIITVAEILISVTGLELAFVAAPQSMKSFVTACWLAVVFLANLLINAPITQLYPLMPPGIYFAVLAGAMVVVLVVFQPIALRFNRAMATAKAAEQEAKAREGNTEAV